MRYFFCLLLWLLAAPALCKGTPEADTFLYEISKPGRPVSYLLGTIHVGKLNATLPADYRRALNRVSQLVVESDESGMTAADTLKMMLMMADNRPLKQSLGNARMRRLQNMLAGGQEPAGFSSDSRIKPWAFWLLTQSTFNPKGYSYEYGIDNLLIQRAKKLNKPVIALEGAEQLSYFAHLPEDVIIRSFDALEKHHKAFLNDIITLEDDYRRQRAEKTWSEIANPAHQLRFLPRKDHPLWHELMYGKLLTQRNQIWLPKLIEILPHKPTLIAVGGAHLFGEQGLIVRLRQTGYQVKPVKVKTK
ncbi:TraB/GumN family protein [Neisseria yangbaofengii]|uniref:TraB/GumN family protein n=1 Tax=Neisseria yangbaofengii TaxID=2709396 RepID=UPI0013EB6A0D|nr:TraB/GumN family protein [Neisseria yangbaofengii]